VVDGIELTEAQGDAQLRLACLDLALRNYQTSLSSETVYDVAENVYRWATKRTPSRIKIVAVGDVVRQQPQQEDKPMQIHDNEQFTVTVEADDAKGFQISGEALTVTSADETVATVQDQGNGTYLIVAGNPGSTVVTFDAGTDDNGNPVQATEAVDVVPGDVATIKLTEGAATPQAPAAPPADGSTGDGTQPAA